MFCIFSFFLHNRYRLPATLILWISFSEWKHSNIKNLKEVHRSKAKMENSLMESLKAKNEYFKQMANLIPPQFYFEQAPSQGTGTGKYFKNAKG